MTGQATEADKGLMPIGKAVHAAADVQNGTALHQPSQIPGSGGLLSSFLPKEAVQRR